MKINIEVKTLDDSAMFLNEEFGKGEFGGEKFDAITAIPSKSLIIKYRGKRYMVEMSDVMRAVLEKANNESTKK